MTPGTLLVCAATPDGGMIHLADLAEVEARQDSMSTALVVVPCPAHTVPASWPGGLLDLTWPDGRDEYFTAGDDLRRND